MEPDEFTMAKQMEKDGWRFCGTSDAGEMIFSRTLGGTDFGATVTVDR